jgi:hypothetical protein
MPTDELENELRSTLARAAAGFENADQASQRLLQRDYRPRTRSRQLAGSITATAAGAALVLGLGLGLSGVFGSGNPVPAHHPSPVKLTAYSLVSNHNGTITLTLRPNVPFHPSALRRLLARHGVPALVRVGSYCYSSPSPRAPGAVQTEPRLKGYPPGVPLPKSTKLVIKATLLPAGTEIGFGFFYHNRVFIQNIIYDHAHSCTTSIPRP